MLRSGSVTLPRRVTPLFPWQSDGSLRSGRTWRQVT